MIALLKPKQTIPIETCDKHQLPRLIFCFTCYQKVCYDCATLDAHKGHDVAGEDNATERIQKDIFPNYY